MSDEKFQRVLHCDTHGLTKWQGHVMCDACGWTYQTKDSQKPRYAPEVCSCGKRLLPPAERAVEGGDRIGVRSVDGIAVMPDGTLEDIQNHDGDWTARPVCFFCYRKVQKRFNGRLPVETLRKPVN